MQAVTKGWPPSRRKAQAENIRRARPWLRSTGPRTAAGKACARMNGLKHGMRSAAMTRLRCLMRRQRLFLRLLDVMPARAALATASTLTPVIYHVFNWRQSMVDDGKKSIPLRHSVSPRKTLKNYSKNIATSLRMTSPLLPRCNTRIMDGWTDSQTGIS